MNALQALIEHWLDADSERSARELARRSGLPPATVDALRNRDVPKSPPREDTLRALARGLDLPFQVVKNAALEAVGYRITEVDVGDREHRAWVALVDDLSEGDRDLLWRIGTEMLKRMKADRGEPRP